MSYNNITLGNVNANNVGTLAIIVNSTLPITYPDTFFNEVLTSDRGTFYSKIAYFNEIPVGSIKAKLIQNSKSRISSTGIYIEFITVLEHYQNKGIGKILLQYIEDECKRSYQHSIYIHVAVDNTNAITWYEKNDFKREGDILKGYYKDTTGSPDAYILKKNV
ncbi:hypothetical protein Kpol_1072p5 [Vanderwaltozyma polyspora DSM 70294]|uniref:N-acetyltransferase domain-containing protein n=1 Tax=Vanderwaltozyma polyspora (strain ATCC 22028 / DSM 70294 / BCRC 21397 / CBS 2163 / NBRC 10782 / NRRL Y-8283 / UCD 57-17) TaxID=436907 RepID=A7TKM3_VANPO|nr:uncharacterized protein Kpol_1072p5 [Vanderwaltozyma polyspora DSM 70294]EDO17135.1 hypothetical protein Kpol_1072p5 [Vanderwaltozyma polyspora DSM 70294]